MKIHKIICDCCNEEIPTVKKKNVFGVEQEIYRFGTLNYFGSPIDCHALGFDLCEKCAGNINLQMEKIKVKTLTEELKKM